MSIWTEQDAKARFSEFLDACLTEGPQIVTRRGELTAILVSFNDWRRLQQSARPDLKDLLLSHTARGELPVSTRRLLCRRSEKLA